MSSDLHFLHLGLPHGVVNQPRVIGLKHTHTETERLLHPGMGQKEDKLKTKGER